MELRIEQVSWGIDGNPIVRDVNLQVAPGEFVGLIGPNGSGKSSLLRCIYRVLKPHAGLISLAGENIWNLNVGEMAKRTAVLQQEVTTEFDFTVEEVVLMGRAPHKNIWEGETDRDYQLVRQALERVGMSGFESRNFFSLSGGEKQRVAIARALAQQSHFLVLDEPTNHLDIRYQLEILELVKELQITSVTALHDLNLAATYCDRLYLLQSGTIVASGTPEEVLRPELLQAVYGVGAAIQAHPVTGKPHIAFFRSIESD
jgi:iron complex transport system ATP-binding protein